MVSRPYGRVQVGMGFQTEVPIDRNRFKMNVTWFQVYMVVLHVVECRRLLYLKVM